MAVWSATLGGGIWLGCQPMVLLIQLQVGITNIKMLDSSSIDTAGDLDQYCDDESFAPTCGANEAIIMETALYGRMDTGKCVSRFFPHMPCSLDVLGWMDAWCSGKSQCSVEVSDLNKLDEKPCPKDYRNYLEARYRCIPVTHVENGCTNHMGPYVVNSQRGYISQQVATDQNCGTIDTPWLIEVLPGQRINVTLLDFSLKLVNPDENPTSGGSGVCVVYATLKDKSFGGTPSACGGKSRQKHVYTSVSNQLEVRLVRTYASGDNEAHLFLLKYEAVGCGDPPRVQGRRFQRLGNSLTVRCDGQSHTQSLHCLGTRWSEPVMNCTGRDGSTGNDGHLDQSPSDATPGEKGAMHKGVAIAIMVGIAVCVGLSILLVGIICIRRRRHRERPHLPSPSRHTHPLKQLPPPPPHPSHQDEGYFANGNDYYRTWQIQQHSVKCPRGQADPRVQPETRGWDHPPKTTSAGAPSIKKTPQHVQSPVPAAVVTSPVDLKSFEHDYESPSFEHPGEILAKKDISCDNVLNYFEIDPQLAQHKHTESQISAAPAESPDKNFLYGRYST